MIAPVSTHSVGAFGIILDPEFRILLCHRTDRDMWNLPGGKVEANESPWQAVVREVSEEVGLRVRIERLLGVYAVPVRADLVFQFLCVSEGGTTRLSEEADDIRWFTHADIPSNTLARQRERIGDFFTDPMRVVLKVQT